MSVRLTTWGSKSVEQLHWVVPELDVREIGVAYRQSRQLHELSGAIIRAAGGSRYEASLPPQVDSEGVQPVLLERAGDLPAVAAWLAGRLREIERSAGELPATAVFAPSEAEVEPLARALGDEVAAYNIQVVPCGDGRVVGHDNDVRVFDIQHIKGLEFEAVFFVGVDRLATLHPTLFDKYLYVGATRAATYLGMTCEEMMPAVIEQLRPHFAADWETPFQATPGTRTAAR